MNEFLLTPRAIIGYMVNKSKLGGSGVASVLGKNRFYLNDYTTKGRIPTTTVLIQIAHACGYEVHIIGHDEDITLDLE